MTATVPAPQAAQWPTQTGPSLWHLVGRDGRRTRCGKPISVRAVRQDAASTPEARRCVLCSYHEFRTAHPPGLGTFAAEPSRFVVVARSWYDAARAVVTAALEQPHPSPELRAALERTPPEMAGPWPPERR